MRYALLTVLLLFAFCVHAQNVSVAYPNAAWGAGQYLGIVRYIHPSHTPGQKHPCIIWLHGSGGTTDYNSTSPSAAITAADRLRGIGATEAGIPKDLEDGIDISAHAAHNNSNPLEHQVVIAPACDQSQNDFQICMQPKFIDYVWQYIRDSLSDVVDTFRVSIVGWSCGGGTVKSYVARSLADAQRVASFVTIAGNCITPNDFCNVAGANLPGWFFHANDDGTNSPGCSSGDVNAINNTCGAAIPSLYKNPATGGHFAILDVALDFVPRHRDAAGVSAPTDSMNIYEWMLQFDRSIVPPNYPAGSLVTVNPISIFDVTQARKRPELLFDGDTTTAWVSDFLNGYILSGTGGQQVWIALDSFITHPRVKVWNGAFSGGSNVSVQFFYDWTDTTRHSAVYTTSLATSTWKYIDSLSSRVYADSVRLIRLTIASGTADNFNEVRIYGTNLGPAPSLYPTHVEQSYDPGKYLQGFGKLYPDTTFMRAGWSWRDQNDMRYMDTLHANGNGKVLTINIFGNHADLFHYPAKRNGIKMHSYFSGPRQFYTIGPSYTNDTKDMPPGADSTQLSSWTTTDSTYYGYVAKLGNNTSASLAGYTFINCPPGAGLGLLTDGTIEVGNEDEARWVDGLRFHRPLVKLMKVKAGYNGAKRADPTIQVIAGALTGIDTSYMKAIWFENLLAFKTKVVPWDVMATNHYCTNSGVQASPGSDGISPEQNRLLQQMQGVVRVRDRLNEGRLYLTEGGYDVFDGSDYDVPPISGQTREQTKAYWVMRMYEITAAAKWDRFYQYTERNLGGGNFSTTGFNMVLHCLQKPVDTLPSYMIPYVEPDKVNSNDVYITVPLDLYWYMALRAQKMSNYHGWPEILQNGDSTGIWALKYTHLTSPDSVLVSFWSGTHNNSTGTCVITLPGYTIQGATKYHAVVGNEAGTATPLSPAGDHVSAGFDESVQHILMKIVSSVPPRPSFRGSLRTNRFKHS